MTPKKPAPIRARMANVAVSITVNGFRNKSHRPYLHIETGKFGYGFIEDRDIKRLKAWCEDCLLVREVRPTKRKRVKK